ncbi:hypothetical protein KCU77_g148, partial [Aureobasidium melanogenum]
MHNAPYSKDLPDAPNIPTPTFKMAPHYPMFRSHTEHDQDSSESSDLTDPWPYQQWKKCTQERKDVTSPCESRRAQGGRKRRPVKWFGIALIASDTLLFSRCYGVCPGSKHVVVVYAPDDSFVKIIKDFTSPDGAEAMIGMVPPATLRSTFPSYKEAEDFSTQLDAVQRYPHVLTCDDEKARALGFANRCRCQTLASFAHALATLQTATSEQLSKRLPKRVRISADVSQKSVLQSHFDTLKGRRSIRVADASRPKSHLLRLAKEIRAMIFEYLFAMMAEGETFKFDTIFSDPFLPGERLTRKENHELAILAQKTPVELPIFFVSKQLSEEAQEVFWTTTTFSCKLWDNHWATLMHVCTAMQKFPPRRRPKTVPRMFPVHRIRRLEISMMPDYFDHVTILEGLWELAKVAHPKLQVHFFYHNVKRAAEETNTYHTTESELANWHKVRAYQILRKESGLPMDFTRNELEDMVSDTRWVSFNLPAIPDKNVKKEDGGVS